MATVFLTTSDSFWMLLGNCVTRVVRGRQTSYLTELDGAGTGGGDVSAGVLFTSSSFCAAGSNSTSRFADSPLPLTDICKGLFYAILQR